MKFSVVVECMSQCIVQSSHHTKIIIYDVLCDGIHFVPTWSILQINYKASTHMCCVIDYHKVYILILKYVLKALTSKSIAITAYFYSVFAFVTFMISH